MEEKMINTALLDEESVVCMKKYVTPVIEFCQWDSEIDCLTGSFENDEDAGGWGDWGDWDEWEL